MVGGWTYEKGRRGHSHTDSDGGCHRFTMACGSSAVSVDLLDVREKMQLEEDLGN